MDKLTFRKINLLIHLAHVDGKFHESEKELLKTILKEKGLEESYLEEHRSLSVNFEDLDGWPDKSELLFWTLKMIHADGQLHQTELEYAENIASALGFKSSVIQHYHNRLPRSLAEFEKEIRAFQIQKQ